MRCGLSSRGSNGVTAVIDSDFEGNSSSLDAGGAIRNDGTAQLTLSRSTFHGNTATEVWNTQGTLNIDNSTFFADFCCHVAIVNESAAAVVQYSSLVGFGLTIESSGELKLEGTVLSGILAPANCANLSNTPSSAGIIDGGYNLETGNSCGFSAANNSLINTNPNISLSSFGFNGGPTPTFALPTGSPAIDKVPVGNAHLRHARPARRL
jgi:hypothetical protein